MAEKIYQQIRRLSIEVFSVLGPGHSERVYHNALLSELRNNGIHYDTEVNFSIKYKKNIVGFFRCDIVIQADGLKMILELKSNSKPHFKKDDQEVIQLERYLTHTEIEHGLLVNFPKTQYPVVFYEINNLSK